MGRWLARVVWNDDFVAVKPSTADVGHGDLDLADLPGWLSSPGRSFQQSSSGLSHTWAIAVICAFCRSRHSSNSFAAQISSEGVGCGEFMAFRPSP